MSSNKTDLSKDRGIITIPDNDGRGSTENKYDTEKNVYTGVTRKIPNPEYNPRARKNKKPEFLDQDVTYDSSPIKVGGDGNISFDQQQIEPTIPLENGGNRLDVMTTKFGERVPGSRYVRDIIKDRADNYDKTQKMIKDYADSHPGDGFLYQPRGMGPAANIADNLKEALDKDDTKEASKEVENIIEEHPEESQEVLPEDTPIQEEAKQITEDTDKRNDEVNNEVVEDFVEENTRFKDLENKPYYNDWVNSKPDSEEFKNAYNSVVRDYGKEEADQQLKDWEIELPRDEDEVSDIDDFEAYARKADEEVGSRRQAEAQRKKAFEEKLRHNNQEAWKDYALETGRINTRGDIRKGFETEVGKSILAEIMTPKEWMNDSLREGVLRHTKFTRNPVVIRNNLRESLAKEKKALGIDDETLEEEAVDRLSEDFDTVDDLYNYLIDWDKVKVYKPGEEMYPGEHSNEWENEPDFDTSEWTADMGENPLPEGERPNLHEGDEAIDRMQERMTHDEDFAGPDELPATYDQIVEPGKELALTSGNGMVPVEEPIEVDYRIIDEEVENDDSIPEEEKEAEKQRRYKIALGDETPEIIGGGNAGATTSAPGKGTEIKEERRGPGSSFGNSFKASMPNGSYNAPSAKGSKLASKEPKDIKSNAGGGTLPPTNEGGAISVNARNANNSNGSVTSNGFISSGATNKTGSSLTVKPVSLPNGEVHTQEYNSELANGSDDKLTGLAKAHVDNIEARVRELPEDVAEAWGFGIKYKHVEYNGTQLDQCTPNQLNEIEKILSRLGV